MKKPNLFIVGAPKCGTTSIWGYLRAHPEIFMSADKAPYYFDTDLWENTSWRPNLEKYLENFSAAADQKKIGEASPSYLWSQVAPKAIKAFAPEAQIIVMLRNPTDLMYALHSQGVFDGTEPIKNFEAALDADEKRRYPERQGYRDFSDLAEQLRRSFDVFGRENVHTIIYDDLKASPDAVGQGTLRFLDVRLDLAPKFPLLNSSRQVFSSKLQMAMLREPRGLHAMGRALIPRWLRPRIRSAIMDHNVVIKPRPLMDPNLKRRLQRENESKVQQLSKLLDRDLTAWSRADTNGEEPTTHNER